MARIVPPINTRFPPYPGGGPTQPPSGGGGGTGGSGGSGGGGATTSGAGIFVPVSNGGVFAATQLALYPCTNILTGQTEYRTFDPTQFPNDPNLPSFYSWRVEQIGGQYRNPTIRKLLWTFLDLGQVSVIWTLTGVTEQQQVISSSTGIGVGNAVPTLAVMTVEVDIFGGVFTGMNLQLSVSRAAGAGPLSILKVAIIGEVEDTSL